MAVEGFVEQVDVAIANFFQSWNWGSTILAGCLLLALIWPILTGRDPDIHPFLLARQAQASPVRQPGESAIYRANEIPMGYPLRKGLGIKDPGAPKWSAGRDGDLRDIWRQAVRGPVDDTGAPSGPRAKLLTVLGREKIIEHDYNEITRSINAIGKYIQESNGKTIAVSLANSTELLAVVFASTFYGFKPVLLPYGLPQHELNKLVSQARADVFIAEAGSIELKSLVSAASSIKHIIWVTQAGSTHMDWNEVPEGVGGQIDISTWSEIIEERKSTGSASVPDLEKDTKHGPIATFSKNKTGSYEMIEYSPENLIAGIGGLVSSLARTEKMNHTDILLPTSPLSEPYALCWTLAALFSGAAVALNSVAGDKVNLTLAVAAIKPTIIVTTAGTVATYAQQAAAVSSGLSGKIRTYFQHRSTQAGVLSDKKPDPSSRDPMSRLRLLFIAHKDTDSNTSGPAAVTSATLSTIRLALTTRIGYALTSASVAGAVTQTNILDYRDKGDAVVNVGAPMTSVEIVLTGDDDDLTSKKPKGKLMVRGPAVVGGKAQLDIVAEIDTDQTVSLSR